MDDFVVMNVRKPGTATLSIKDGHKVKFQYLYTYSEYYGSVCTNGEY